MIVRVQHRPFRDRSERMLRLQGFSLIALGVTTLIIWNPVTQPGPRMCMLRHAVGLPCPLCGMTRGVSLCLRGRFDEASLLNPLAGPVLVLAVVLAVKWAIEFASGRRIAVLLPARISRRVIPIAAVVVLVNWIYLLIYRREDPFLTTWLGQLWAVMTGSS